MSTTAAAIATAAASNPDKSQSSPSLFSLLPNDVVLNIFARVPKRFHPILYCVSKSIGSLLRSSAFHETRSVLGNDSLYLCFKEHNAITFTSHWFSLHRNKNAKIQLTTTSFSNQPRLYSTAIAVQQQIYLFGVFNSHEPSNKMWILDTRSGIFHEGPSMRVNRLFAIIGLIDYDTIYVSGGCCRDEHIQSEMFNTKTQIWEIAPNPDTNLRYIRPSGLNLTVNGKICVASDDLLMIFDPKNGKCLNVEKPKRKDWGNEMLCVVDNVVYGYFLNLGLMWYDCKLKIWRSVKGLDRFDDGLRLSIGMTEFSGKLAVLWEKSRSCYGESKEILCTLIELVKDGIWIYGKLEQSQVVNIVPRSYRLQYSVYFSD